MNLNNQLGDQVWTQLRVQLTKGRHVINSLTDRQWEEMISWREEVRSKCLSNAPADIVTIERVVGEMYEAIGAKRPKVVRFPSPNACLLAVAELAASGGKRIDLTAILGRSFLGSCDGGWVSFYEGCARAGVKYTEETQKKLSWWIELRDSAFWWWAFEGLVVVSDRPETSWDERKRLHHESGPAVRFSDGYELYSWHGIRVSKKLITEPESYTSEEIRKMTNSEEVRALAERLGWDAFLAKLGTTVLDRWKDQVTGLTYELLVGSHSFGERQPRWLRMQSPKLNDGTRPHYIEPVDPRLETAKAARKWQLIAWRADDPDGLVHHCNQKPELRFSKEA